MTEIPTATILRISDDKTLELLDLYRQHECLWNTNDEFYKDQLHRRLATENIASILDVPYFTSRHVVMKFKNLRNAFSQELKKIAKSKQKGVVYKPSVFWYKKMEFIRPHLQHPRGGGCHSRANVVVCQVDGSEPWLQLTQEGENSNESKPRVKRKSQQSPTSLQVSTKKTRTEPPPDSDSNEPYTTQRDTEHNEGSNIDEPVKNYIDDRHKAFVDTIKSSFKDLSTNLNMSSRDDVFDSFGKYVSGLLRTLPQNVALGLQPQIINLITKASLESNETSRASVQIKIEKC